MVKFIVFIFLMLSISGCATFQTASEFQDQPLYYASDEELLQTLRKGLEAQQNYPNLKIPTAIKEIEQAKLLYTNDELNAIKDVAKAEIARRIYNERVQKQNQRTMWEGVSKGLAQGLQNIKIPTASKSEKETYYIYDSQFNPVPVGRIEKKTGY